MNPWRRKWYTREEAITNFIAGIVAGFALMTFFVTTLLALR